MFSKKVLLAFLCLCFLCAISTAKKKSRKNSEYEKQLQLKDVETRETDPPNFVRLVIMRLIYGLAVQMGLEERLSGFLNGAFVPPNAEDDDYGFGDIGGNIGGGFGDDLLDF